MKKYLPLLAAALGGGLLAVATPGRAVAQKIQEERVAAVFHKSPALVLAPQYKTYTVDYDLGSMMMSVQSRPSVQGLTYQKADGDLLLRITVKNLFINNRKLTESTRGTYSAYYTVGYSAEVGYELRDTKTDQVLNSYHRSGGTAYTQAFNNVNDLNSYMANAFVGEKARQLLDEMTRRADFALNPHDYPAIVTLYTVEGEAPSYADLNKTTADFKALLAASKAAAPAQAQLQALASTWQQHMAKANWEDKKSEINKKVASALLLNMCAVATLSEDYAHLDEYISLYNEHNKSFFVTVAPSFLTPVGYGGTAHAPTVTFGNVFSRSNTGEQMQVDYADLAADLKPAK